MAGCRSIDVTKDSAKRGVTKDSAKRGAVVKTVMNLQAISLPVAELSAFRRDSCCLQLVCLSVSELNHAFCERKLNVLTVVTSYVQWGQSMPRERERDRQTDERRAMRALWPIYCLQRITTAICSQQRQAIVLRNVLMFDWLRMFRVRGYLERPIQMVPAFQY